MKKIIILSLFILFPVFLPADFVYGPKIDYKGKPSDPGKHLFEWFSPRQMDWRFGCFFAKNKKLIEWEIEKMLKEEVFKMDFFPRTYVNSDYALFYLMGNHPAAKRLINLVEQYYKLFIHMDKIQYILMKLSPSWKNNFENRLGKHDIDKIIKKYDKLCTRNLSFTVKELKEKAYNNYMRSFKNTTGYSTSFAGWTENWNRQDIIQDILKQKAVNLKNFSTFIRLLSPFNTISDDIAEKLIEHFKLNTASPQINISFLKIIGKNPKLTKAILKHFNLFKEPSYDKDYYVAAALVLNKNVDNISPSAWVTYASITGDYNGVFKKIAEAGKRAAQIGLVEKKRRWDYFIKYNKEFIKRLKNSKKPKERKIFADVQRSLKNPGWYPSSISLDNNYLRDAAGLINKGSNLKEQTARLILNNISTTIGIDARNTLEQKYMPEPKFGKLLPKKLLEFTNTVSLPFGSCFPFESLSPSGRKTLFLTYSDIINKKGGRVQKKVVIKKLLSIKSPKYRKKTIRLLMSTKVHNGNKALEGISLKWLPELLKIAGGKDPELGVKACQLVGKMSILGLPAAPELKNLLKTQNDFTIKIASICALAEIGDKSSISLIKQYCNDKNRLLARAAKQAVYLLQPIDKNDPYFEEMLRKKAKTKVWR